MHRLIISVVPKNSAEFVTAAANKAGAAGGSVLMGRGTASNSIIQLLGLGDTSKEIVLVIAERGIVAAVIDAIKNAVADKKHFGVIFSVAVPSFFRSGDINGTGGINRADGVFARSQNADAVGENPQKTSNTGDDNMVDAANTNAYEMINIIVNKGYAEDAMAAARKAGAGGGTILSARGTAKEGDEKFFGMEIVPEKEMLMILVPSDKKEAVLDAVKSLPCLEKAGSGIVFSSEVESFSVLGK
ncbi:MAG: transcriptional regulator [Spirochaetaceae bacterium]|nr:transcriptional regulator [Spirochaetaceae bacterium]